MRQNLRFDNLYYFVHTRLTLVYAHGSEHLHSMANKLPGFDPKCQDSIDQENVEKSSTA